MDNNQQFNNTQFNAGPNPYEGVPMGQVEAPSNKAGGLAIASLVLGILSLLCCCIGIGVLFGLLAIIFAIISLVKKKGTGFCVAGIITGAIGLIFGIISCFFFATMLIPVYTHPDYIEFMEETVENGGEVDEQELQEVIEDILIELGY